MLCTKSAAEAKQRVLSGTPGAPWCWVQTAEVAKERMQKEEEPTPMKWAIKRLQLHTGVWEFYKGLGTWEPGIANAKLYATESEALGDWQERRFEVVAVPVRVRLDEGEEAKTVKTKWKVTKADGSSEIVTQLLVKDGWLDAETVASSQDDYLAGLLIPLTNVQSVERVRSEWVLRAKGLAGNREWLSKGGTGVYWTSDKEKAMRFGTHAEAWQQKRHLESLALAVEGRPDVKELVYLAAAAVEVEEVADAE
jgi:hypothetical protein